jgi:hypothetical protein
MIHPFRRPPAPRPERRAAITSSHHVIAARIVPVALSCLALASTGGVAHAQALTGQGPHTFTLDTFVSNVPTIGGAITGVGPIGVAFRADGKVLVTDAAGDILFYPNHSNGQTAPCTCGLPTVPNRGTSNAVCLAMIQESTGWKYYMTEDIAGVIMQIDEDGQDVGAVVSLPGALCLIPYPPAVVNGHHGHLFATAESTSDIFEIDPSATPPTISTLMTVGAGPDGIAFSEDGSILYAACTTEFVVKGYDVSSGALVWTSPIVNSPPTRPDGIAIGLGSLSGYLYANYNNDNSGMHGTVWEFGLPGPHLGDDHVIVNGGSRGDFIAVDPNVWSGGAFPSLLFTQSDRIMRLDPPGGGWIGPPTQSTEGVLCTTCFARFCEPGIGGMQGCPCSNPAVGPGRGCNNFGALTGGAALDGSGTPSLNSDHVSLAVRDENASALTVFWTGTGLVAPPGFALAAVVRCVSGIHRLYTGSASGGAITRPGPGDPSVSARSAAVGVPISPGQTRYYFTVYRDPQASIPCGNPTSTANVSNAVGVMWTP